MNQLLIMAIVLILGGASLALEIVWFLLSGQEAETLSKVITASTALSILLYAWLSWPQVKPEVEPVVEQRWGELVGDPEFDPEKGIYANVLIGTVQTKVVIQPKWWKYFSSDLIRSEKEAACPGSPVTAVSPGKEPSYLVVIQDENGITRGMGCRAKMGLKTVLLTAYHVTISSQKLYIAKYSSSKKAGARVEIDRRWEVDFYARDDNADIAGVLVPDKVWSSLGVGVVKARVPSAGRKPCQTFGADSSAMIKSSSGLSWLSDSFSGIHTATTAKSWSGAPIISNGFVIGVHKGADRFDQVNKFTILHPVMFPVDLESDWDEGHIREIDEEEMDARSGEFSTARIYGRGDVSYLDYEYAVKATDDTLRKAKGQAVRDAKFKGRRNTWADMVEDDDDDFFDSPTYVPEGVSDSDIPLNCQGAGSACSPPSKTSVDMSSPLENLSPTLVCPFPSLVERVSNLEKLLEPLLAMMSSLQEASSQNSKILTGLSAEVLRNSIPSSSKPAGSPKPKNPPTSVSQSSSSVKSTPEVVVPTPLKENGTPLASKRKSRRSRKGKSKVTPHQESPSQP